MSKSFNKFSILSLVFTMLIVLIAHIDVQAAANNITLPEVVFVGVDHSPLVVGDKESFSITSKNADKVQYRVFMFTENTNSWKELTSGYTAAMDAKTPYTITPDSAFELGKYKLAIRVKRAGTIGVSSDKDGDYDSIFYSNVNCVNKDDNNRVYSDGVLDIEKDTYMKGEKVTLNGIKNIRGMKGPYTYKMHVYDVDNNQWIMDSGDFRSKPEWVPPHAGTYVLDVWGISSDSTLLPKIKADPSAKLYESWKLKIIKVIDIASVNSVNLETKLGVAPNLPQTVTVSLSDSTTKDLDVVWNNVDASAYAAPGTVKLKGIIKGTSYPVNANIVVKGMEIASMESITVQTRKGVEPILPKKVSVTLVDGNTLDADVVWNSIDSSQYSVQGSFEAVGSIVGSISTIKATVYVNGMSGGSDASNNQTTPTPTPTPSPQKKYKVVIDPGHGGYDSGAVGPTGVREKDITLLVGLKLGALLEKQNVQVIYTRNSDKVSWPSNESEDLIARTKISDDNNPDFYISLHCNSFSAPSANGVQTHVYTKGGAGDKLATAVQDELVNATGLYNRKVQYGDNFYVIKYPKAPSILVEMAFVSNPQEEQLLNSDDFQNKCADALARAVMKSLN